MTALPAANSQQSVAGDRAAAALDLVTRGYAVLPLHSLRDGRCTCGASDCKPGKHPRVTGGHKAASTDLAQVTSWWRTWPDANIGVATGRDRGLVVLDVDPRHGGDRNLDRLLAEHGALPPTPSVRSGGGGTHFWFAAPSRPLPSRQNLGGGGLDLKADGGYIVAVPSLHESGETYEWIMPLGSVDLAGIPDWVEALADKPKARADTPASRQTCVDSLPPGARNDAMFRYARGLVRRYPPLPRPDLEALVRARHARAEQPEGQPFTVEEALSTLDSALRYPPSWQGTDLGNAELFAHQHGDRVLWCQEAKRWFVFTGSHWQPESNEEVTERATTTVRSLYSLADRIEAAASTSDTGGKDNATALRKHARASESAARIRAMVDLARHRLPISADRWDRIPAVLNCPNGTLDLTTGVLRPHAPEELLTRVTRDPFEPAADCPRFRAFLERIFGGDRDLIAFVQRAAGYSILGEPTADALFVLWGTGRNGKTTFLNTIRDVLGTYGYHARPQTFMAKKHDSAIPNDVAQLAGVRFVSTVETGEGGRLDEAFVKAATGRDPQRARFLHREFFEFKPEFVLFIGTNHKPEIRGNDLGIWSRIRLIPFTQTIPEPERDPELGRKLAAEGPGVLKWLVEGCREFLRTGLAEPAIVRAGTEGYREEMDTIGAFLEECTKPGDRETAAALYAAYQLWTRRNGGYPLNHQHFAARLRDRGFEPQKSGSVRWRLGLSLLPGWRHVAELQGYPSPMPAQADSAPESFQ